MFIIFTVCRIAIRRMTSVAVTIAWTKDGIIGATWTSRKLQKLGNKANPKKSRGWRRTIFMQDRFAIGNAAKMNKEIVEWTRNGGRTNVFAHRSRNANCYFIIPCKFNFAEFRGREGEFLDIELKWKLAAQTVSRCERHDLRSRLTDNFVENFAKQGKTRRDATRHIITLLITVNRFFEYAFL